MMEAIPQTYDSLPSDTLPVSNVGECTHTSVADISIEELLPKSKCKPAQNSIPNGCINHKLAADEEKLVSKLSSVNLTNRSIDKTLVAHEDRKGSDDSGSTSQGNDVQNDKPHQPGYADIENCSENTTRDVLSETNCTCEPCLPIEECSEEKLDSIKPDIEYVVYESELQMPDIMRLITKDLSEPYSIYTYRYFIHNWPKLCFLAKCKNVYIGAVVCKLDIHKKMTRRGYIAMLAIDKNYRRQGIGSELVLRAIKAMVADDCDEVVLETEITNKAALRLYENLGFVRDKRLFRYYLNGVDALRLKLWLQ